MCSIVRSLIQLDIKKKNNKKKVAFIIKRYESKLILIPILLIFNYAVAVPVRVYIAGLYRCIIYIRGEPYRAG